MNIFALDRDPLKAAQYHCDRHVVKMILEYAQLLSTAHHLVDNNLVGYRPTHTKHPSALWTACSSGNYYWLYDMWRHLLDEYSHRYDGRVHATSQLVSTLKLCPLGYFVEDLSPVWLAMPDQYKRPLETFDDSVQAYREYYINEKWELHQWTNRPRPEWMPA